MRRLLKYMAPMAVAYAWLALASSRALSGFENVAFLVAFLLALPSLIARVSSAVRVRLLEPLARRLTQADRAASDERLLRGLAAAASFADVGRALTELLCEHGSAEGAVLLTTHPVRHLELGSAPQSEASRQLALAIQQGSLVVYGDGEVQDASIDAWMDRHGVEHLIRYEHAGELEGLLLLCSKPGSQATSDVQREAQQRVAPVVAEVLARIGVHEQTNDRLERARADLSMNRRGLEVLQEALCASEKRERALRTTDLGKSCAAPWPNFDAAVDAFAAHDAPVLIVSSESQLALHAARAIHERSPRRDGPFLSIDCADINAEDVGLGLVGTGDAAPHEGWLQLASAGTLMLHNFVALPLRVQELLAQAFARGEVPAPSPYRLEARVMVGSSIGASALREQAHCNPALLAWFRESELRIPHLAERRSELPALARAELARVARMHGLRQLSFDSSALDAIDAHAWSGGLAELRMVVERAVERAQGSVITAHALALGEAADSGFGTYAEQERELLKAALDRAAGNKSEAARALGLKRTTLIDKLRRHHLDHPDASDPRIQPN